MTNVDALGAYADATVGHLDVVFHDLEFEQLCALQDALHVLVRDVLHSLLVDGAPSIADVADGIEVYSAGTADWVRSHDDGEATDVVMMLLSAVAVAIAWWTHRHVRPPVDSIRRLVMDLDDGDAYLLPILGDESCFCDSGMTLASCHGRPPATCAACAASNSPCETTPSEYSLQYSGISRSARRLISVMNH
jgi:hypothetical protein